MNRFQWRRLRRRINPFAMLAVYDEPAARGRLKNVPFQRPTSALVATKTLPNTGVDVHIDMSNLI
jgi:hypothetical protein